MNKLRTFYALSLTQVLSIIGSMMTSVALGIRVFNDTGNSTPLLLASFFAAVPPMFGGSIAGVLVDRWPRKRVLIISDIAQAVGTILLLVSFLSDSFELWHLYAVALGQGLFGMMQRPALEASVTMLVLDSHRDRANAIRQMTGPMAGIIAPPITGLVYAMIGVTGVMIIDLVTLVTAVSVITFLHIPQPEQTAAGQNGRGSILNELKTGFQFVWSNRILFYLMLFAAGVNFLMAGPMNLLTPYIITLTDSEATLGILLSILDLGIVVGGVLMGIWGGTRPRMHGIMLGLLFRAGWIAFFGLARTPMTLALSLFFVYFANALVDASFASIVQLKTKPEMQGRVFALLLQIMYIANPLSLLVTGPLVDNVLTPAVGKPGWELVAPLVGTHEGSGMGLLLFVCGVLIFLLTTAVYLWPRARHAEASLPDYTPIVVQAAPATD